MTNPTSTRTSTPVTNEELARQAVLSPPIIHVAAECVAALSARYSKEEIAQMDMGKAFESWMAARIAQYELDMNDEDLKNRLMLSLSE